MPLTEREKVLVTGAGVASMISCALGFVLGRSQVATPIGEEKPRLAQPVNATHGTIWAIGGKFYIDEPFLRLLLPHEYRPDSPVAPGWRWFAVGTFPVMMRPAALGSALKGQDGALYELTVPKGNDMRELNDLVRQLTTLGIVASGGSFKDINGARNGEGYLGSWKYPSVG